MSLQTHTKSNLVHAGSGDEPVRALVEDEEGFLQWFMDTVQDGSVRNSRPHVVLGAGAL